MNTDLVMSDGVGANDDPHKNISLEYWQKIAEIDEGIRWVYFLIKLRDHYEWLLEGADLSPEDREEIKADLKLILEQRVRTKRGKLEDFEESLAIIADRRKQLKALARAHEASAHPPGTYQKARIRIALRPPDWWEQEFRIRQGLPISAEAAAWLSNAA